MGIIKAVKLAFDYLKYDEDGNVQETQRAVDGVDVDIREGQFVAILGHNGSGKSTFAKHINALLLPSDGTIWIDGINTLEEPELWKVRQKAGMVFQNPDNQIIGSVVEEDVGFGPENMGVPTMDIWKRVNESLEKTGMTAYRHHSPNKLSGGQKQRVAIARALASNPKILLCDEATSALDPQTTASILELLKSINEQFQITIVIITHQMSVIREICNRVAIIEHRELVENGLVEDIFSHPKSKAARELILRDVPENSGKAEGAVAAQMERIQGDKKLRIVFTENSAFEPVIANMILQFGKPVNILRADTKNVGGVAKGEMILGLPDDRHLQIDMEQYLTEHGLEIEEVTGDVE